MAELQVLFNTYDLKNESIIYYRLLHDIRGNFFQPMISELDMFEIDKNEEHLNLFKKNAYFVKRRYKEIFEGLEGKFNGILKIMELEAPSKEISDMVEEMYNLTEEYDFEEVDKFWEFYDKYDSILNKLKEL